MRTDGLVDRLISLQIRRPFVPLAFAGLVSVVFGFFASRLELRTRYDVLLPEHEASVQELHRIEAHTSTAQTVLVVIEGPNHLDLRAMGDAVVPRLLALGPGIVTSAEDGIHQTRSFLEPRAALFLPRPELQKLVDDVEARWDYEVQKRSGFDLLDEAPPPPITADALESRFRKQLAGEEGSPSQANVDRYPDGYYERADGHALVVVARSPIAGGDLGKIGPAMDQIHAAVAAVQASRPEFASIKVSYAGTLPTGYHEFGVVREDLVSVGGLGIGLVLAAVLLYFLRWRAVLVMAITIGVGLLWTFGLTELVIGHLNIATAFLISIVAGNGINVGILYQARYFEQRGKGDPPPVAVQTAMHATWVPTLIAALGAVASYGSLLTTDFRAFRDFGFIAASGMVLCWIVKTLMVPPLLILLDPPAPPRILRRFEMSYGKPFGWLVSKAPVVWTVIGVSVAVLGSVCAYRYALSDPMEYDMDHTQNDRGTDPALHRAWEVATEILGGSQGAMAVLADSPEQAREVEAVLRQHWEAAPANAKPFVAVHSLWDLIPSDQEGKLPLAHALGKRLEEAHRRGLISPADWARLGPLVPPPTLAAFGLADLPEEAARPFSESNGTRGTLVLIESEPTSSNDVRYLLRYADSFRETKLPSGAVVRGSGMAVIFADMLKAVVRDIPIAISLSLGLTLLTVFVAFRHGRQALVVLLSLLTATAGVAAYLYFSGQKINFLNFAALPITFGIGVDYAVNVAQRYHADGDHNILATLRTSGGAVVLCSLTTMLSYLALLDSHNLGIRSLGSIAAVGEVSCLLSAVVLLPSIYLLRERHQARTAAASVTPR